VFDATEDVGVGVDWSGVLLGGGGGSSSGSSANSSSCCCNSGSSSRTDATDYIYIGVAPCRCRHGDIEDVKRVVAGTTGAGYVIGVCWHFGKEM